MTPQSKSNEQESIEERVPGEAIRPAGGRPFTAGPGSIDETAGRPRCERGAGTVRAIRNAMYTIAFHPP